MDESCVSTQYSSVSDCFIFLLQFCFREWSSPENLSEEKLIAILKVTKIWMIEDGIKFAVHYLHKKKLSASHQLQLAQQFSIESWIKPAVGKLLETPVLEMEQQEIEQIGLKAFAILVKAKETLEQQHRLYAWYPPQLPEGTPLVASCTPVLHRHCQRIWKEAWLKFFPQHLLHPTTPLSLTEIFSQASLLELSGMNLPCKEQIIQYLQSSDFLLFFSHVVDHVVYRIVEECCAYDRIYH